MIYSHFYGIENSAVIGDYYDEPKTPWEPEYDSTALETQIEAEQRCQGAIQIEGERK